MSNANHENISTEELEDRAGILYAQGDVSRADLLISEAVDREDAGPTVFYNFALVRMGLGDYRAAIEGFSRAMEHAPEGYVNRGLCYERIGDLENARRDYERALELDPDDVAALVDLGTLELAAGNLDEAEKHLSHAAGIDPTVNWQLSDVSLARGDIIATRALLSIAADNGEDRARVALSELDDDSA